jgi:hypothetical protein
MQVRSIIAATILGLTAATAMSQEIDRADTLQGKALEAQAEQAQQRAAQTAQAPTAAPAATDSTKTAAATTTTTAPVHHWFTFGKTKVDADANSTHKHYQPADWFHAYGHHKKDGATAA